MGYAEEYYSDLTGDDDDDDDDNSNRNRCSSSSSSDGEREDLPNDFKEYADKELNWYLLPGFKAFAGGVFWSPEDDQPQPQPERTPTLPAYTLGFKKKIRDVLQWIIEDWYYYPILFQFWAPITTKEGRSFLTTQNQPFALVPAYNGLPATAFDRLDIRGLCRYRMISKDYKFYIDLDGGESSSEEDLGLPGRVFKHQFPESTPNVEYYSIKKHSLRDDALRCRIRQSLAFPVFEPSTQRCVGVIEVVTPTPVDTTRCSCLFWNDYFRNRIYEQFEEVGLNCSVAFGHGDMKLDVDQNFARVFVCDEIDVVLKNVCEVHGLPLAQAWVQCKVISSCRLGGACGALVDGGIFGVISHYNKDDYSLFRMVNNVHHLKKGVGVAGRAFLSTSMVFCRNVTQLSLTEYPLAHYAQEAGLSGCFAICLQSSFTGNDVYVLEFFMPVSNKARENIHTSLRKILETMRKNFRTLRVAFEELGEELCIEEIDFQNGGKLDYVQMPQTTISLPRLETLQSEGEIMQVDSSYQQLKNAINNGSNVGGTEHNNITITCTQEKGTSTVKTTKRKGNKSGVKIKISVEDILQASEMSLKDAAKTLKVSKSTLKRVCRDYGIERWPPRKTHKVGHSRLNESARCVNSDHLPSTQASATVVDTGPRDTVMQDANIVTIKAKYGVLFAFEFCLSLSSGLVELQQEVAKWLKLEAVTYFVKNRDEDGDLILIACDEDLRDYICQSRSLGKTSIVVRIEPKLPIA